jgi:decaprenylphospho-beta-D-erythro-pentofuranosid-2-ulose 2-reductase
MNSLIIGASAGLGAALANQLAAEGHNLFLIASDERDLSPIAKDLALRFGVVVKYLVVDLIAVDGVELRQKILAEMENIEALFYVAGYGNPPVDHGAVEAPLLKRLLGVNFTSGVTIINAFLDHLSSHPEAHLVGIGSVATIRGRGTNVIYGAAKQGLEFYFSALRHAYQKTPMQTQFYRLGFMQTNLLGINKTPIPAVSPKWAAAKIIKRLHKNSGAIYLPYWWGFIAMALKLIPWFIFRRMSI